MMSGLIGGAESPCRVSVVLFEGFDLLDVSGPVELFSWVPDGFEVTLLGPAAGPVRSDQGVEIVATTEYAKAAQAELVMVPGGRGTSALVEDKGFLSWLAEWAVPAKLVTLICTGSGVLAAAGLLDGYRATSNKLAFPWATAQGRHVDWVPQARWVEDRERWTSSGVAAGMDMAAALIAGIHGQDAARDVARKIELETHQDANWDPFARFYGLA